MTAATQRSRAMVEPRRLLVRILFAILILVPVTGLFIQVWQSTGDRQAVASQEREGIEYLNALGPLLASMTQAQSASVAGGTVDEPSLTGALGGVAEVDGRLGQSLRVHERWIDLRSKIEALSAKRPVAGQPAFDAYGGVVDLLLALYNAVRENSQLVRDPEADGYYLQDGVAQELPEFMASIGRFSDLAFIVSSRPASVPTGGTGATSANGNATNGTSGSGAANGTGSATTGSGGGTIVAPATDPRVIDIARLLNAQDAVRSPANDLTDDLQAAVAVSESTTLGTNLFTLLDRLRLTMDAVASSTVLDDGVISPSDATALAALRTSAVEAVNPLFASVLDELDVIVTNRLDQITVDRRIALVALVLAVVIAWVPTGALLLPRLRGRRPQVPAGRHGLSEPDDDPPAREFPAWAAAGPDLTTGPATLPRDRERSGAAR